MIIRGLMISALLSTAAAAQAPQDSRRTAERNLFEKMVEIPTVAGRGQMPRLTSLLANEFRSVGITDIVIKDHEGQAGDKTQTMIVRWPAVRPSGKKPILLMAHMDVVEAKRSDWTHDPFEFREADGFYWGRGTSDNKQGVAAILLALKRLKAGGFEPRRDIIALYTGDEETKQNGAKLAASDWRKLIDSEFALNLDAGGGSLYKSGKPDSFSVQVAEKTYADYRLVATNPGGHSSRPRPDNAIYQLAAALKALEEYRFEPQLDATTRAMFEARAERDGGALGELIRSWLANPNDRVKADLVEANLSGYTRTRCIATQLSGGHAPNALPQRAEAIVNCRIFPGVKPESVTQELRTVAGKEVSVELFDGGVWSSASPPREDVSAAMRKAIHKRWPGAAILPMMSAGATDAIYTRAAGIPTYGVSGEWGWVGESSGAHGLNERIVVKAFHDNIDVLEEILRDLTG